MAFPPQVVTQAVGLASDLNLKLSDYTGPASYTTGGVTVSASAFGMLMLYGVWPMDLTVSGNFFVKFVSPKAPKAKTVVAIWFTSAGVQVGNGVNLSAEKIRVLGLGV